MSEKVERRAVGAAWEIRSADDGKVGLRGYAALFDSPSHGEVIRSSAFTRTLAHGADVRLLVNHDGVPIARTKSGTLSLSVDERGLLMDAPDLDMGNPTVAELVSALARGDIDQCSFAFIPVRESYDDESKCRELLEVRLMDVSVVTYPWYEDTSVSLKELDLALAELRSGAVTPEARDVILRAIGDELDDDEDDEDEGDEDEDEGAEPVDSDKPSEPDDDDEDEDEDEEDDSPARKTPEAIEPRVARNLEIARLYLA